MHQNEPRCTKIVLFEPLLLHPVIFFINYKWKHGGRKKQIYSCLRKFFTAGKFPSHCERRFFYTRKFLLHRERRFFYTRKFLLHRERRFFYTRKIPSHRERRASH